MVNVPIEKLQRLALIASLKRDTDTQALARVNGDIQTLQTQVVRLRRLLHLRGRALELDPSRLSGADMHWVRHTERQIIALQAEIAGLHVERETLIAAAALAVGRAQDVDRLVEFAKVPRRSWD